jgi:hypothetical protein
MAARSSFDMTKIGTADRILIVGGFVYFINSFLPWNRACVTIATFSACGSANLWHGVGILAALLVIALLTVEVLMVLGTAPPAASSPALLAAATGGILVFSVLKVLIDNDFLSYGAWLGLILALVLAVGGYLKYQSGTGAAPPAHPEVQ